jgi:histidinol phosphatase-like enzyme
MSASGSIGHNGGPPLDGPDAEADPGGMRLYAWRKAHRAAWRAPSYEALRVRTERANALGLTYRDFTAVLLDRGRNLTTLFFGFGGTLVRLLNGEIKRDGGGAVALMPSVRQKLAALKAAATFVVTHTDEAGQGENASDLALDCIRQVAALCAHTFTDAFICADRPGVASAFRMPQPGMVFHLLDKHRLTRAEAVLVGDTVREEECARRAGLGLFIWAWRYFGEPPAQNAQEKP